MFEKITVFMLFGSIILAGLCFFMGSPLCSPLLIVAGVSGFIYKICFSNS